MNTRRLALATALTTLLLSGCAHHGLIGDSDLTPDPANPKVVVVKDRLAVTLEPLRFFGKGDPVTITWTLVNKSYRFDKERGIEVMPLDGSKLSRTQVDAVFRCGQGATPQQYQCTNNRSAPGKFKYTIRVRKVEGDTAIQDLDPVMVNDWD